MSLMSRFQATAERLSAVLKNTTLALEVFFANQKLSLCGVTLIGYFFDAAKDLLIKP
jgi:hypothetical protein